MKNKNKQDNALFRTVYDPYSIGNKDTFNEIYDRYSLDSEASVEIDGLVYYRALQIITTKIKTAPIIIALDNKLQLSTGDNIIDDSENIFNFCI